MHPNRRMNNELIEPESKSDSPARAETPIFSLDFWSKSFGMVVGLSAPAVVIGYYYLKGYYRALGASWYVPNLSNASIVGAGVNVLLVLLFGFVLAMSPWPRTQKGRRRLHVGASLLAIAALALVYLPQWVTLSSSHGVGISLLGSGLLLLSGGMSLRLLMESVAVPDFKWSFEHTGEVVWLTALTFGMCLSNLPVAEAAHDLDASSSVLPRLTMPNVPGIDLRLVHVEGDSALIVQLGKKGERAIFKMIKLDSTVAIQAAS
jgi:hypothetical protein